MNFKMGSRSLGTEPKEREPAHPYSGVSHNIDYFNWNFDRTYTVLPSGIQSLKVMHVYYAGSYWNLNNQAIHWSINWHIHVVRPKPPGNTQVSGGSIFLAYPCRYVMINGHDTHPNSSSSFYTFLFFFCSVSPF
jgi:hypothetical protein